jgi:hypothetical protein
VGGVLNLRLCTHSMQPCVRTRTHMRAKGHDQSHISCFPLAHNVFHNVVIGYGWPANATVHQATGVTYLPQKPDATVCLEQVTRLSLSTLHGLNTASMPIGVVLAVQLHSGRQHRNSHAYCN